MPHSSANSGLCMHFAILRPFGTTPRAVRGRLGHNGCIVRLTGADSQHGSHNLCELACHKVSALMVAETFQIAVIETITATR